jgi:hypothetical protein
MLARVSNEFNSLPHEAQRQVEDFIRFLADQYQHSRGSRARLGDWESEPFVGMWSERANTQDSGAWVRRTRQQEWTGPGADLPLVARDALRPD